LLPTAFSVENYRAFARRQEIEIRPLTLFFGWNSGGKSALVRFLPLLAESVRVGGPPIWLAGEVGRGATWPELVCRATGRPHLRFGLQWADEALAKAEWEVMGDVADGRFQEFSATALTDRTGGAGRQIMLSASDATPSWDELLRTEQVTAPVASLSVRLSSLLNEVQWISGLRQRPPRVATYGGGTSRIIRPDGADAVDHLIAAQLRSTADPVLASAQRLFGALGVQLILDNPVGGVWRVLLHPAGNSLVRVNLSDTGEGYAQVLPVLVALARSCVGGPRILCLEQPELHLHTHAQAELSRLLVETARHMAGPHLLIETHSEVLLMTVQLAIANGDIPPEKVRVYWVESRPDGTSEAVPVDFDLQGRPTTTALMGAFDQAIRLGQELIAIHLRKMKS